ncbi:AraC family transcriptional regulator [Dyadobacter luteus]|jgi:AraC family transcriptional regulator|uniref:AraC family transcriptional regulator n=1 Tax=Dyadobacter luteus TaxID=2259619 RepID=A0A3D8YHS5_9BACT|nr:helix-turn-helix domain-containing protein [Dyadobacter luteus]REA64225.1 AraC family transcriptional regulator [Dyadobacter luteus]
MQNNDFKGSFSLLNADHIRLNKNWNYHNVISPFYRIYLIDDGAGSLGDSSQDLILEKGFLYLVPSFTICNHHCSDFLSQYYIHVLEESADGNSLFATSRKIHKIASNEQDMVIFKRILSLNPGRDLGKTDNPKLYDKQPTLAGFRQRNNLIPFADYIETQGLILQLMSRFMNRNDFHNEKDTKIPSRILEAIHFMQTNLHTNITVEQLAERASQHPNYFSRLFQRYTSERPLSYLQKKRVERAQFLIATTSLPLSEIASETGFESLSYFSRIFKNVTGLSPTHYKINNHIV